MKNIIRSCDAKSAEDKPKERFYPSVSEYEQGITPLKSDLNKKC